MARDRSQAGEVTIKWAVVNKYDQIIREDLERQNRRYRDLRRNKLILENEKPYTIECNLVNQQYQQLAARLLGKGIAVDVTAYDPKFSDAAAQDSILVRSLVESSELKPTIYEVLKASAWAPFGVFEVGHPLDVWSHDPQRRLNQPNVLKKDDLMDEYLEIDPALLVRMGIRLEDVQAMAPEQLQQVNAAGGQPVPLPPLDPAFGYPWVQAVDPRLIVLPAGADEPRKYDYVCRLRFISVAELKEVQGYTPKNRSLGNGRRYEDLYREVEHSAPTNLLGDPNYLLVAELWILRDRDDPSMCNYYMSWLLGEPDEVIRAGPNPRNGVHPFVFFKINPVRTLDANSTFVEDILKLAQLYADTVDSVRQEVLATRNHKWGFLPNTFKDQIERDRAADRNFSGGIEMKNLDGIKRIMTSEVADSNLRAMVLLKSLVQMRLNVTPMEEGQAMKGITAAQTNAIMDAVGMNIQMLVSELRGAITRVVMKMLAMTADYGMGMQPDGTRAAGSTFRFTEGSAEGLTSRIFNVIITDAFDEVGVAERLAFNQGLKTVFSYPQITQAFDARWLAREFCRVMGWSVEALATGTPQDPALAAAMAQQMGMGGGPTLPGNLSPGGGMLPPGMVDMVNGQHPERGAGDQGSGVSVSNSISGLSRVGS